MYRPLPLPSGGGERRGGGLFTGYENCGFAAKLSYGKTIPPAAQVTMREMASIEPRRQSQPPPSQAFLNTISPKNACGEGYVSPGLSKESKLDISGLNFPLHPGNGQVTHSPGTSDGPMPWVCPNMGAGGLLKFQIDRRKSQQNHLSLRCSLLSVTTSQTHT